MPGVEGKAGFALAARRDPGAAQGRECFAEEMAPGAKIFPDGVGGGFEPRWSEEKEVKPAVEVVESIFLEGDLPAELKVNVFWDQFRIFREDGAVDSPAEAVCRHGIQVAP